MEQHGSYLRLRISAKTLGQNCRLQIFLRFSLPNGIALPVFNGNISTRERVVGPPRCFHPPKRVSHQILVIFTTFGDSEERYRTSNDGSHSYYSAIRLQRHQNQKYSTALLQRTDESLSFTLRASLLPSEQGCTARDLVLIDR